VIYRFVREALTNIGKHARATGATIRLFDRGDGICCSVRDDGAGFDVAHALSRPGELGLGLRGIQDRFEAVGGVFEVVSAPGAGTELRATVPLES
jgi:two-component system NarL family sensor kinase